MSCCRCNLYKSNFSINWFYQRIIEKYKKIKKRMKRKNYTGEYLDELKDELKYFRKVKKTIQEKFPDYV